MSLVTVVSMVKNEEKFIRSAVESIMSQNIDLELIVVDDKSNDATLNILNELQEIYKNLKVMTNNGDGKVNAFLQGCSLAKGEYMAFFAGDDIMPVGSLQERLKVIKVMEGPAVLLSKLQVISDDKSIDGTLLPKKKGKGSTSGAAIMIDKEAAKYLLDIPKSLPNEDTWMELCIKFLPFLNIKSIDIVACNWRVHPGNSNSIRQSFNIFNERFSIRMEAIELFYKKFEKILDVKSKKEIIGLMKCEKYRRKGNFIAICFTGARLSDKIRFIFYSNSFFFHLKKKIRSI